MKKLFIFLLILVITVSNIPGTAFAADDPKLEVIAPNSAQPDDEISVDLVIKDNPGIMVMILDLDYDNTCLKYIGFEDGIFTGWEVNASAVWIGSSDFDADGTILTLKFKVLSSAAPGSARISVTYDEGDIANYDEEIILPELVPGYVEILGNSDSNEKTTVENPNEELDEDLDEGVIEENGGESVEEIQNPDEVMGSEDTVPGEDSSGDIAETGNAESTQTENELAEDTSTTVSDRRLIIITVVGSAIILAIIMFFFLKRRF